VYSENENGAENIRPETETKTKLSILIVIGNDNNVPQDDTDCSRPN